MIEEEVNDWIHTAVDERQAARDEEPVSVPRLSITTQVNVCELRANDDDLEDVEGEPGDHKGHYDAEDHLEGVSAARFSSGICCICCTVAIEMHSNGPVTEHEDQHREEKGE